MKKPFNPLIIHETHFTTMRLANLLFIAFIVFGTPGCATSKPEINQTKQQDVAMKAAAEDSNLYNEAKIALLSGDYLQAATNLGALAIRHPFDNHAQQALLETAEDSVKRGQANAALTAAENFIRQNPSHPQVDYAYYHRGVVAFYDSIPALEAANPATATPETPAPARRAFQYLSELLRYTPSSKFAADTTQRMLHIRNTLAQHEVAIARHYLAQGEHTRAAARAKYVVGNYQSSPAATEALAVLTQASTRLTKASEVPVPTAPAIEPAAITGHNAAPASIKSWLLSQNPEHYTLQLFSTGNEKFIKNHIARHHLSGKADYFRNTATTYALVYGAYPTRNAAQQAITQLPRQLIAGTPWIRRFKSIHATLGQ